MSRVGQEVDLADLRDGECFKFEDPARVPPEWYVSSKSEGLLYVASGDLTKTGLTLPNRWMWSTDAGRFAGRGIRVRIIPRWDVAPLRTSGTARRKDALPGELFRYLTGSFDRVGDYVVCLVPGEDSATAMKELAGLLPGDWSHTSGAWWNGDADDDEFSEDAPMGEYPIEFIPDPRKGGGAVKRSDDPYPARCPLCGKKAYVAQFVEHEIPNPGCSAVAP